ncbi:hypothetical protein HUG15_15355 [Salicibibacter cibarius]|uniref:Uncharacterized protein n=1 Tax=Salicibibacter cibarius TaxID=2743000 RepID=A0A7T7CCA8_9BACI|nr:hypothetical protein [Salicibibacter cibarius]QQK76802.1 hypothetical protein HUG15_15355 [Salicibibacter cibarius]
MSGKDILRKAAAKSAKKRGILSDHNYRQWLKENANVQTLSGEKSAYSTNRAKKALLKRV